MALDAVASMARLLHDADLRRRFRLDPAATLQAMGVREDLRKSLALADADGLNQQAASLLNKRFHALARLIPRTMLLLGPRAWEEFVPFAAGYWPTGHLRHAADAAAFGMHLRRTARLGVCHAEIHVARFVARRRRLALCWAPGTPLGGRPRRSVQIIYRRRGRIRQLFFYLRIG